MKPFKLTPVFRDYLWGGTRLKEEYGKKTDLPIVAESWELYKDFPLLIKLIDAKERLSVQVHPDDEYARLHGGGRGKTEMWVILQARPGAFVYYGFNREVTCGEVKSRALDGTLTDILRPLPVRRGDVVFVPAGTVHAIGEDILLAEIQQNSDVTYRLFDYNRVGADGMPRPLHIGQALETARFEPSPLAAPGARKPKSFAGYQLECLASCEYFTVDQLTLSGTYRQEVPYDYALICCEGDGALECEGETMRVTKGDSIFVPAASGEVILSGIGWFLTVKV